MKDIEEDISVEPTTNFYEDLKVKPFSDLEEIKSSYKKLALIYHPDKGGNKECFQKITRAYKLLSDISKREIYDKKLKEKIDEAQKALKERDNNKLNKIFTIGQKIQVNIDGKIHNGEAIRDENGLFKILVKNKEESNTINKEEKPLNNKIC